MAQEAVGGDLELEQVAAVVPASLEDLATEELVLRRRGRERPEVVLAQKEPRRLVQRLPFDRTRMPPGAPRFEGRRRPASEDAVAVASRQRGMAGVEVGRRLLRARDGDVVGQDGVQRLTDPRCRRSALDVDARDLAERMNAGIRASCDGQRVPRRIDLRQRRAQLALDGSETGLSRPAAEASAVVLECEPEARRY